MKLELMGVGDREAVQKKGPRLGPRGRRFVRCLVRVGISKDRWTANDYRLKVPANTEGSSLVIKKGMMR